MHLVSALNMWSFIYSIVDQEGHDFNDNIIFNNNGRFFSRVFWEGHIISLEDETGLFWENIRLIEDKLIQVDWYKLIVIRCPADGRPNSGKQAGPGMPISRAYCMGEGGAFDWAFDWALERVACTCVLSLMWGWARP